MINFGIMKRLPVLFAVILSLLAIGCKKPKNNSVTGGGKGGNSVINVTPEAYNIFVDTCMVYIKYGTLDAPANGVYDDSAVCQIVGGQPVASFSGLTVGLYYFYGVGYHSGYGHPPNVKGSAQQTVQSENTYTLYMPTYSYIP